MSASTSIPVGEALGRPRPSQPADPPSGAAPWWRTPDRTWRRGRADARLEPAHTGSLARWESPLWRWPPSVWPDRPRPARRLDSTVERRGGAGRCHSQHPAPRWPRAGSAGQVARLPGAQERTRTAAARCPHRCWPGGRTGSRSALGRSRIGTHGRVGGRQLVACDQPRPVVQAVLKMPLELEQDRGLVARRGRPAALADDAAG